MTTPLHAPPYGRDTSASTRLFRGRLVSGSRLLAEAALRRLLTQRGTLLDDPNYGLPLVELLNKPLTKDMLAALPGMIRGEVAKDPRLIEGSVVVEIFPTSSAGQVKSYEVLISAEGGDGTFDLALSVDDISVSVLSLPEDT